MYRRLKPGELRVIRFGRSALKEIVHEYLMEHGGELFDVDIVADDSMFTFKWDDASGEMICISHRFEDSSKNFFADLDFSQVKVQHSMDGKPEYYVMHLHKRDK